MHAHDMCMCMCMRMRMVHGAWCMVHGACVPALHDLGVWRGAARGVVAEGEGVGEAEKRERDRRACVAQVCAAGVAKVPAADEGGVVQVLRRGEERLRRRRRRGEVCGEARLRRG